MKMELMDSGQNKIAFHQWNSSSNSILERNYSNKVPLPFRGFWKKKIMGKPSVWSFEISE